MLRASLHLRVLVIHTPTLIYRFNRRFGFNSQFGGDGLLAGQHLMFPSIHLARPRRLIRSLILYLSHFKLISRFKCELCPDWISELKMIMSGSWSLLEASAKVGNHFADKLRSLADSDHGVCLFVWVWAECWTGAIVIVMAVTAGGEQNVGQEL
jgi:hypothetical protein